MDISNKTIYYSGLNALRLEWPAELSVKYGVLITFNEGEEDSNEVKYEVQVTRLKPGIEGQALFQIERISDVFVNEILPDLIADRLAYAAGKVFYPLVITVDQNGGFQVIYNHQEILKRWPSVKNKILSEFEGVFVEDYLDKMEKRLADVGIVELALLNNDWFIQTFFKPIYKQYGQNYISESLYKFPIAKEFKADGYLTKEKLSEKTNNFGAIELLHQGTILPITDVLDMQNNITGNYEGYYLLHPKVKRILSIVSNFSYEEYDRATVNVKIFAIPKDEQEFDSNFTLDTNITEVPVTEMVIMDGPPQKSFLKRLLNI
jgi:hypothetical protein